MLERCPRPEVERGGLPARSQGVRLDLRSDLLALPLFSLSSAFPPFTFLPKQFDAMGVQLHPPRGEVGIGARSLPYRVIQFASSVFFLLKTQL